MLGVLRQDKKDVVVVGAGVSGLIMAYALDRRGYEVTLYEASNRVGGLIHTNHSQYGIAELAANSILVSPKVGRFFDELGVELCELNPESKKRYILRDGKPRSFPLSLTETLAILGRAFFKKNRGAKTLNDWAVDHLGEVARDYLIDPMVKGIYGAAVDELSVAAIFPRLAFQPGQTLIGGLFSSSKTKKKKEKGKSKMAAPRKGMESLVLALENHLRNKLGTRFKLQSPIEGKLPQASNTVLSVPAYRAAEILKAESQTELAEALASVRYAPIITASVFYKTESVTAIRPGVGVLFPSVEKRKVLGILYSSDSFPDRVTNSAYRSFTVMLGGTTGAEYLKLDDQAILKMIAEEFSEIFGVKDAPVHSEIYRWEKAIPVYSAELEKAWDIARVSWCSQPGHVLFGNYTAQVSIRGLIEQAVDL